MLNEGLPELRKSKNPAENKNNQFLVQALLMGRSNFREDEWVERYAAAFRELFKSDDSFRDLVNEGITDESLKSVQDRLDAHTERH